MYLSLAIEECTSKTWAHGKHWKVQDFDPKTFLFIASLSINISDKYIKYCLFSAHVKLHSLSNTNGSWKNVHCHVAAGDLRGPCLLGEVYSPGMSACPALLWPACRAPFSLGSAPSSCICRQLYIEGGTNTFLCGYELQLTDRGPE